MTKRAVDAVFLALFALTDLRAMLRKTAPDHRLDPQQQQEARALIAQVRGQLERLEEDLLP
ncbi:MAG: hypothetical protein QMD46_12490 [Methanomicrobiales archaeon]|nr:hypothetical protein [Methanomicrobiales archaeon]MDI6877442.1 hypothetical protein [Methanomicrobiales archaeon]